MIESARKNYTHLLQELMQRVGISSFKALSKQAGVTERVLRQLRQGRLAHMQLATLQKISQALQVTVIELLTTFSEISAPVQSESAALKQEYQRLQVQMQQQQETLKREFQHSSMQILEPWLLQWPTVVAAAKENPDLPAVKLLPLVRPVEKLIQQWGVEAIANIGEEVAYDPQWHQLMAGTAQIGDHVKVRYAGYRQGDKLLYRAKVSLVSQEE